MKYLVLILSFTAAFGTPFDTPWSRYECQGETLDLFCEENKEIKIEEVFWGRINQDNCIRAGELTSTTDCNSPSNVKDLVATKCDGKGSCSLNATPSDLGDPCSSTFKVLQVEYKCMYKSRTSTICEDEVMTLTCPTGQVMKVYEAFYGAKSGVSLCGSDGNTDVCESPVDTHMKVGQICDGHEECEVRVLNDHLGDPCPGTPKYLEVKYVCDFCRNDFNDVNCTNWAKKGECENNFKWMNLNCRQSCWKCNERRENCDDIDSGTDCQRWKSQGYCTLTPDYMNQYCAKSCGTCEPDFTPQENAEYTAGVCEGDVARANCGKDGLVMRLTDLLFGRKDDAICPHESIHTSDCPSPAGTFETGAELCDGRQSCLLPADASVWGDPCNGTYKYLRVFHTCQKCEDKFDSSICQEYKVEGRCQSSRDYMMDNCFKTCTRCDKAECGNVAGSDKDCDRWAAKGECKANEDWMQEYCRESCRKCGGNTIDTCVNKYGEFDCSSWAAKDECSKNPFWMRENCRRVCGKCDNSECFNANQNCVYWQSIGECSKNPDYMKTDCAKACKTCSSTTPTGCHNAIDADYLCDLWASKGDCTKNEAYMRPSCAKSCNFC